MKSFSGMLFKIVHGFSLKSRLCRIIGNYVQRVDREAPVPIGIDRSQIIRNPIAVLSVTIALG